jgi:hypothetical protein
MDYGFCHKNYIEIYRDSNIWGHCEDVIFGTQEPPNLKSINDIYVNYLK